ncbi:MAG: hypothetical protein GY711_11305 [bacterium]|nr:hypothetical protein [bacterium]
MADWTNFHYDVWGCESRRHGVHWIPAGGTNRPFLIYFHGSGFESGAIDALYDPIRGERFFLDQIEPREFTAGEEVVVFSVMVAQNRYDGFTEPPDWTGVTAYAFDDLVEHAMVVYRCIKGHTNIEPGVAAGWGTKWEVVPKRSLALKRHPDLGAHTPAFLNSGMRDAQAAWQHIVANADLYGIDPDAGILMGQSAGGQKMAATLWGRPGRRYDRPNEAGVHPSIDRTVHRPLGGIFRIVWDDLRNYPDPSVAAWTPRLIGRDFTPAQWAALDDRVKQGLSPLGILEQTGLGLPSYFDYPFNWHDDGNDNSAPYATSDPHHAKNGWNIFSHLVDALGASSCVFTERHPTLANTARRFEDTTSVGSATNLSTAGTGLTDDQWTWAKDRWGI